MLLRLDARDRALLTRWAIDDTAPRVVRLLWLTVTRLGGVVCSVLIALLPFVADSMGRQVAVHALATLVVSHLAVQLVKRTVTRPRPSRASSHRAVIEDPDRFSFPSGHSAAAMSVAFAYAVDLRWIGVGAVEDAHGLTPGCLMSRRSGSQEVGSLCHRRGTGVSRRCHVT